MMNKMVTFISSNLNTLIFGTKSG